MINIYFWILCLREPLLLSCVYQELLCKCILQVLGVLSYVIENLSKDDAPSLLFEGV